LAERLGRKLIYLPIGQLGPGTLRKIRSFHVLDGHHVREYAEQYIRRP
jgi:Mor family transcriptional regulator